MEALSESYQQSASSVLMLTLASQFSTVSSLNHNEDSGVVVHSNPAHSLTWLFHCPKRRHQRTVSLGALDTSSIKPAADVPPDGEYKTGRMHCEVLWLASPTAQNRSLPARTSYGRAQTAWRVAVLGVAKMALVSRPSQR